MSWMTTRQAVQYASKDAAEPVISERVLTRLAKKNKVRHGKNGNKYLFKPEFIDDYFLKQGSGR